MKDNKRVIIKWIILMAIAGVLIIKFALPKAEGPEEMISGSNQTTPQQEVKHPDAKGAQYKQGDSVRVQEETEADKSGSGQSASSGTTVDASKPEQNQQTTESQPEVFPVWLLFRSTTCIPCIEMQKTMDALQPEFKGKVNFVTVDVNDPSNREMVVKYQIRYIPTTYLYDRNKKLYFQQAGAMSVEEMRSKLQALVEVK